MGEDGEKTCRHKEKHKQAFLTLQNSSSIIGHEKMSNRKGKRAKKNIFFLKFIHRHSCLS